MQQISDKALDSAGKLRYLLVGKQKSAYVRGVIIAQRYRETARAKSLAPTGHDQCEYESRPDVISDRTLSPSVPTDALDEETRRGMARKVPDAGPLFFPGASARE